MDLDPKSHDHLAAHVPALRTVAGVLVLGLVVLAFPGAAVADNCGDVSDCFGDLFAAALATAGAALLAGAASMRPPPDKRLSLEMGEPQILPSISLEMGEPQILPSISLEMGEPQILSGPESSSPTPPIDSPPDDDLDDLSLQH